MATVIGLTLAKVNNLFHLDVKNSRWSVKRAAPQSVTGGGVVTAIGQEMCSGSFDEVTPKEKGLDWRKLKDFAVEIYDKETRSIVVAAFTGCNWTGLDGSSDLAQAMSGRNVTWVGSEVVKA